MIRIVVAEDHPIVREGICRLLEDAGDLKVVGEADNGREAVQLVRSLQPDLLLLDISMPQVDGLETLTEIQACKPAPHVVSLSMIGDLGIVRQALQKGALAYILKQSVVDELLAAVRAANRGSVYLGAGVVPVLAENIFAPPRRTPLDRLSPREREVVAGIVAGYSAKELADNLHTSIKTVEQQRRDAMRKLEVDNIASLVRVCFEFGLGSGEQGTANNG